MKTIGTDSDNTDVVEVVWLEPGNCDEGVVAGSRFADIDAVHLDHIFVHCTLAGRLGPSYCSLVRADGRERDIRGGRDVDAEDIDEFGNGSPKSLQSSVYKPESGTASNDHASI